MLLTGLRALALLALLLPACVPAGDYTAVYQDVPDPLSDGGMHTLPLTMAWPDADEHGVGPYPAVLFLHGGGWMLGYRDHEGYGERMRAATGAGYIGVTAEYRLTSHEDEDGRVRFPWPAQLQDVKCAVRWLRAHAQELRIDPDHIATAGHSSGGQLAMMAALTDGVERFESPHCEAEASSAVSGAISRAGVSDLSALLFEAHDTSIEPIRRLLDLDDDADPSDHPEALRDASPVAWAGGDVPILHVQGLDDPIVPPSNPRRMAEAQELAGGVFVHWEFEDVGHTWRLDQLDVGDELLREFLGLVFEGEEPEYLCSPWPSCEGRGRGRGI